MESESRTAAYLHSLDSDRGGLQEELRAYAREHGIPIVRRETESLLRTLLAAVRPKTVLEIGTAIGYSSICMAEACGADILTIENFQRNAELARANILRSGYGERISLVSADAGEVLPRLVSEGRKFDFIFLDAAKGQYLTWLPDILELMKDGSVLVADNVLQDNTVTESRFSIARRDRTIHERMREFLYRIKHDPVLESAVLTAGDGVSVSVRKTVGGE